MILKISLNMILTNTAKRKRRALSLMVYFNGVIGIDMCKKLALTTRI